jgi:DNA-binding IclR family transcriptional regulator
MPLPIDRGRQSIFDRESVIAALSRSTPPDGASESNERWAADAVAARMSDLARRRRPPV